MQMYREALINMKAWAWLICLCFIALTAEEPWKETPYDILLPDLPSQGVYDLSNDKDIIVSQEEIEKEVYQEYMREIAELTPKEGDYRLRLGDTLSIAVYGEAQTRFETQVGMSGKLNYLFIKNISALGKTIPELREILTEKLKEYYRYPVVIITPVHFAGESYTVIGEVNDPGKKTLTGNTTLISGLCEARGFRTRIFRDQTVDLIDYNHSFLARRGEVVPVDFASLIKGGDLSQDVRLEPGDYIYIAPKGTLKVFVVGEVYHPVTINFLNPITIGDALAEGGGLTVRASSRALVIRGSLGRPRWFLIDINRILKGLACDFPLEDGDIVYVPPMKFSLLKEYIQGGISAFVSIVANVAGTNAFLEVTPKAKGTNVASPVPVIGAPVVAPVIAAPAAAVP